MFAFRPRVLVGVLIASVSLAACGGGGATRPATAPAEAPPMAPAQSATVAVPLTTAGGTYALPLSGGYSGTISLGGQAAPRVQSVTISTEAESLVRTSSVTKTCPSIPVITFANPFPFPITIPLSALTITAPCSINGALFGVTFVTLPATTTDAIAPIKLGDVTGTGRIITFVPAVQSLTLPPHSRDQILILHESANGYAAFPVIPNTPTILTPGTTTHTSLAFKYDTASGGTVYQAACFDGAPPNVPPVGTPAFYCNLDPGPNAITFGSTQARFFIGVPKPDGSVLGLDGKPTAFNCKAPAQPTECVTTQFTISSAAATGFQNVVVTNVAELQECIFERCVDSSANQQSPSPAPSSAPFTFPGATFAVVVQDDPTYKPTPPFWDGQLRGVIAAGSVCHFADPPTFGYAAHRKPRALSSVPPQPSPSPSAVPLATSTMLPGPAATFNVMADATGSCTIAIAEDPAFVTNVPGSPSRTVQQTVTVQGD